MLKILRFTLTWNAAERTYENLQMKGYRPVLIYLHMPKDTVHFLYLSRYWSQWHCSNHRIQHVIESKSHSAVYSK